MTDPTPAEELTATPEAPGSAPPAPLRRSRRHKVISGVCGGAARHWDLDPVILRIVLVVLTVSGGVGLIAYGFAWLLIPLEGEEENEGRRLLSGRVEGAALTALLFAIVGCGLFLSTLNRSGMVSFTVMLSLAVAGSAYWSRQRRRAQTQGAEAVDPATAQAVADAPPETVAPPSPDSPSWWRSPLTKEGQPPADYLWGPSDAHLSVEYAYRHRTADPSAPVGPGTDRRHSGPMGPITPTPVAAPRKAQRTGRSIGGLTFLLAMAAGAAGTFSVLPDHRLAVMLQTGLACALAVFGIGLVLSAWIGRTGGGTIFMVILTAALLAGSVFIPKNITTDWRQRTWRPENVAALHTTYELGSGRATLNLSDLHLKDGETVRTAADVGAGQIRVIVPNGVTARMHVRIGLGDVTLPGESPRDIDIDPGHEETYTLPAKGLKEGEKPHGTLELDLQLGAGEIKVLRDEPASPPPGPPAPTPSAPSAPSTPGARP
ncbi:PspC domain-containing protein [Streptomyces sp. NPDC003077]|uniref:PspC domain-containing protein n=1 Tax=Streptomyces sp. NPDC003077 TaxID=3154443 RepID=UPI0033A03AA0